MKTKYVVIALVTGSVALFVVFALSHWRNTNAKTKAGDALGKVSADLKEVKQSLRATKETTERNRREASERLAERQKVKDEQRRQALARKSERDTLAAEKKSLAEKEAALRRREREFAALKAAEAKRAETETSKLTSAKPQTPATRLAAVERAVEAGSDASTAAPPFQKSRWVKRAPALGVHAISFSGNRFKAVTETGTLAESTNGIDWADTEMPIDPEVSDFAVGGGTTVAVTRRGILTSEDGGRSWTIRSAPIRGELLRLVYANNRFVAAGRNGTLLSSQSGKSWNTSQVSPQYDILDLAFGNGKLVGINDNRESISSDSGANWTSTSLQAPMDDPAIAFGNGRFVVVSKWGSVTSDDGMRWTPPVKGPQFESYSAICFGNDVFVAFRFGGYSYSSGVAVSKDGVTWIKKPLQLQKNFGTIRRLGFGNGVFVAESPSRELLYSTNGSDWKLRARGERLEFAAVAFGDGKYLAIAQAGDKTLVMVSPDGVTWTLTATLGVRDELSSVAFGNGHFVAVGRNGCVLKSSDGQDWRVSSVGTRSDLTAVVFADGRFSAFASREGFFSENGSDWRKANLTGDGSPKRATAGNGLYAGVGNGGLSMSTNGIHWWLLQDHVRLGLEPGRGVTAERVYRNSAIKRSFRLLTFLDGYFFGVTDQNEVSVSKDVRIWSDLDVDEFSTLRLKGFCAGRQALVGVGGQGVIVQLPLRK